MNYPVPTETPRGNAKFLDNRRLNKFITEYQQMLNVAMGYYGATGDQLLTTKNNTPYSIKSHLNHPCTIWVRNNRSNFLHAIRSTLEFYNEHIRRGGKGHENVKSNIRKAIDFSKNFPPGKLTSFPNCTVASKYGVDYRNVKDVHLAYKLYLNDRWDNDNVEPKWIYDDVV